MNDLSIEARVERLETRTYNILDHIKAIASLLEQQARAFDARMDRAEARADRAEARADRADARADRAEARMEIFERAQQQTQRQLDHLSSVVHHHATDPDAHKAA